MFKINKSPEELAGLVGVLGMEYGHTLWNKMYIVRQLILNPLLEKETPKPEDTESARDNLDLSQDICGAINALTRGYLGDDEPYDIIKCIELIERTHQWPQMKLYHQVQEGTPSPRLFRGWYELILDNVYRNAQRGSEIRTRVSMDGNLIATEIEDNGPGMTQEQLRSIEHPFVSYTQGGRGIGLTTTKLITEISGGTFHIQSEQGKGTVVKVCLMPYEK